MPFPPTTFAKLNSLELIFSLARAGCIHIDRKPDAVVFIQKLNHPSRIEESRRVRHGEDARSMQAGQNHGESFSFRCADEQDVSAAQIFAGAIDANDEIAALHGLADDHLRQRVPERVFADHANDDRRERIRKRFIGPLHELEKIEQVGGLDLIFRESILRMYPHGVHKVDGEHQAQESHNAA